MFILYLYLLVCSVSNNIKKIVDASKLGNIKMLHTKKYSVFFNLPSFTVAIFVLLVKEFHPFNTDLKHDLSNDNSPNVLN